LRYFSGSFGQKERTLPGEVRKLVWRISGSLRLVWAMSVSRP
jgi:hypothetical protein